MTSNGRKKKLVTTVAGIAAAAALLLGFVFTTVAANNSGGVAAAYAATQGNAAPQKHWLPSNFRGTAPIEDPPYLVPFSQAAATVEKAFPDSKITSGEREYMTIKTKSSPPRLPSPGTGSGSSSDVETTITPAYVFNQDRRQGCVSDDGGGEWDVRADNTTKRYQSEPNCEW